MEFENDSREKVIYLPKESLENCNGFSFDFGASVIKVCYLARSDSEDRCKGQTEGPLRLTSFAREELDECLQFIKEKSFIRRTKEKPKPVIYTTGLGGFQYGKLIEEKLDVTIENVTEMDGFALTMESLLATKPLDEFCFPFDQKEGDSARKDCMKLAKTMIQAQENGHMAVLTNPSFSEEAEAKHDRNEKIKTYVLGLFGSAWSCMKMGCYDKGKFSFSGFTTLAGRSFLGLGCMLTGAKDYKELMDLAEKGNNLNIDETEQDVADNAANSKESTAGDMYSTWKKNTTDRPTFPWGKGVGKNLADFKREDVARTLLYSFCHHLAITAYDALILAEAKHIFIAGSFCNLPLVQKIVLNEFEYRKWFMAAMVHGRDADYHIHLLQYGSYFGAIGAIFKGKELCGKDE